MIKFVDKPATYIPGRPGNMGGEVEILPHWTQMLVCSDGRYVYGYGGTKEEAESEADRKRKAVEYEVAQSPKHQIRIILERCSGRIYEEDQQRLLRLLCRIALGDES